VKKEDMVKARKREASFRSKNQQLQHFQASPALLPDKDSMRVKMFEWQQAVSCDKGSEIFIFSLMVNLER
jgi:hypothetical protein